MRKVSAKAPSQLRRQLDDVVVVGASLAGFRTVQSLRALGYKGRIHLVGAEPHLPYDRPPLSKGYLAQTDPEERIWLATLQELDTLGVALLLGRSAIRVDPGARFIELDDGSRLDYDAVVIATGASPRLIAGLTEASRPASVHTLRTIEDARLLSDLLITEDAIRPPHLVVVGAGFIGSEVASTGLSLGAEVTLVDSRDSPLNMVLHSEVGQILDRLQTNAGAQLRMGSTVREIMVDPDVGPLRTEVRLDDGGTIRADIIVVGVGVTPNTAWLDNSGLAIDDGLICDETLRATDGVWAAGDVTRWSRPGEVSQRLEHWTNAGAQAEHVARSVLAGPDARPFVNVPYYWSDQFGMRIEVIGIPPAESEVEFVLGSATADSFVALYRSRGQVVGAAAMNATAAFLRVRTALTRAADGDWTNAIQALEW